MAQRRMISPNIIDTDEFMDMPASSQALYFHMLLRADDDGFLANPKRLMRLLGSADDDFKVLVAKRFVVIFDTGVCVIRHWRVHNLIRADRYHETMYKKEKDSLSVDANGIYEGGNQLATTWQPNDNHLAPEVRLGKVRLGKDKEDKREPKRFQRPSFEEVKAYCNERHNNVNPQAWIDHYESNGWKVGKNPMKDWKAAVRTWENSTYSNGNETEGDPDKAEAEYYERLKQYGIKPR